MTSLAARLPPSRAAVLLPVVYMAGIFWLSSIPGEPTQDEPSVNIVFSLIPPTLQNLLHIPVFGLLAWLWHWALRAWLPRGAPLGAIAFAISFGYGIADELHQMLVPGRYASLTDVVLNTVGAGVILLLVSRRTASGQGVRRA